MFDLDKMRAKGLSECQIEICRSINENTEKEASCKLHEFEPMKVNGIYNAYLTAIAPTQSISYVQNATSSIMPITEPVEVRTYGDSTTIYPMPFLTNENMLYYQSGYRMDMRRVIDIVATTQQHVDQGISTTLFVTDDKTTRDIARYYIYAYKKGLKSLYYTRTKMTREDNECLMCSV